ncbi:MAG: hypothetical protein Kow002_14440 [Anaerolineales bacterium]
MRSAQTDVKFSTYGANLISVQQLACPPLHGASLSEAAKIVKCVLREKPPGINTNFSEDYEVTGQYHSYLSPKLEARPLPQKGGYGVFAREFIKKGDLLVLWGGRIVSEADLDPTMPDFTQRVLQIEEGLFMIQPVPLESSDYFNHSCNPNAGFSGQIALVAMRDIQAGEEVCFDYAMCDGSPYDEFVCSCGAENCRGNITGEDWKLPELRERYAGYYMPYLQRRIDALNATEVGALKLDAPVAV